MTPMGGWGGMSGGDVWLTASYGAAGEMLGLMSQGFTTETRTYNTMLQLTRVTAPGMDMQYMYTAGANNGRITQSIDGAVSGGETLTYTYDTLNRLSGVSGTWGQTYSYDGFGNLTGKS